MEEKDKPLADPAIEAEYWRKTFRSRPYYRSGREYSEYEPAYRYGWESATRPDYRNKSFREVERDLEFGWPKAKGSASTTQPWHDAKEATKDAWDRVRRP